MPILIQNPITRSRVWLPIPLLLWWGMCVQLSAQCTLSCDSGLQVSLDPTGKALITALMVAPNSGSSCPGLLSVTLYNSVGQPLPNPLTCAQVGQTVTAKVKHMSSGNFCTGTLEVYDALPPTLANCGDKFVFCNQDPSPEAVGMPTATDNCTASGDLNFSHFDTETSLGCGTYQNGVQVLKRIDRNWTVSDDHGNASNCLQHVWLKHITVADITYPSNLDNISAPALSCGQNPDDLDVTGQPMAGGVPVGASPECEIAVSYTDQTIFHCAPAAYTVLRNWTTIDFCLGTLSSRTQIIKVEDKIPPTLTAPPDVTIGTDGFYCSGSITLPQAEYSDNCSSVTVTPQWEYGSGYGPFSSITEGEHVITYTATDACGNSTTATMRVTVVDTSPPQAICASDLQVSLSTNGLGFVNAAAVNVGSYDNCGPVFLSISRDEVEFAPQVEVSCADQGAPLLLTLKVTDAVGLENLCQMEVMVRDFLKPVIQCPANVTLTCLQDYQDLGLTGNASASDNCALKSLHYSDVVNIQPCNIGSVARTWIATDSTGNTKSCVQQITANLVNTTTVAFPPNVTVASCGAPGSILPPATGQPVIGGQSCSPLSVNYTDQIFTIAPPACFRIFRAWKVIDHCIYNPNGGTAGIWEQTQIIDVVDHSPPVLTLPLDITVSADQPNCTGMVLVIDATATDCSSQITITNNSGYSNAGGTNASGLYPIGTHFVTFTASDGCGNSAEQTLRITVQDITPPTAVCLSGLTASIGPSGTANLDALAFDGGCFDLCSPQNGLTYSISPSSFGCPQVGLQPVLLTVRDTAGNVSNCNTFVNILDNAGNCNSGGGPGAQIEGTIRNELGVPVRNIPVSLTGDGFFESVNCDTTGRFAFNDIPTGGVYFLQPANNANWLNGVSTYDLVLISKHILGTDTLDSPYEMLAADANRSGSITTFDIVQLRKLILGINDSLTGNTSWRFIDSSFVFPDPHNPFSTPVPEQFVYDPLASNRTGQNFIGIKVGDVNLNSDPANARSPKDTLFLELTNKRFRTGEALDIPFALPRWTALEGMQFEIMLDPHLISVEQVDFAQPDLLGPKNFALHRDGMLSVSWDNATPLPPLADARIFTLHLRAQMDADLSAAFSISGQRISPEAYQGKNEPRAAIALRFEGQPAQSDLLIFPNPASGAFNVQNPFAGLLCALRIMDCQGRQVWEQHGFLPEQIVTPGLQPSGLYFVELNSARGTLLGKVVIEHP